MSVASKNPFALLDAEDSSRPTTPAAPKAPAAPQAPAAASANRNQQKTRGGPAARGGKYYPRGGKPGPRDSAPVNEDVPVPEGKKFEGGRGGRGGRGRGGRGGRGGAGQRFDRHSQSGKTDSDKKIHQGWGGDDAGTELKAEEGAVADAAADSGAAADWGADASAPTDWAAPTEGDAAVPAAEGDAKPEGRPRREREPEEEDNTLTLDQYLAQQKEKDTVVPKIEGVRQANEGAGDDLWKDAVPLSKNEEEEAYFAGKTKSAPKAKAEKKEKVYLEIDARFERPDRGGRGRGRGGDRGGDRGRGGERRGRGARPSRQNGGNAPTINVDDQNAFPSLS